jgi:hypothetical protein
LEDLVRARIAASVVLAVGILLGTAGCNFLAPQATLEHYDPSDGVGGTVGNIDVRNAVIVSNNGETGNLIATFVNNDAKSHRVLIQQGTTKKTDEYVTVEPGQVKTIGSDDSTQVQFTKMNVKAGAMLPVYFQYADKTGVQLLVPVLTNGLKEYKSYTPTPAPASPLITPAPSETPATNG